ncbi:NAD-dependent epimerase/dehydratase family protein [Taibaiella lutea]|uniref:NAD-dependent epimerase/dehydratase family protein n=1 Tax=Taibaiella lutea TaxID=2608001 RepID=A0A5M6CF65_9BACT|nr:NAD-dependent epimerase/dehydratase family protein [Taibaiella lutea]KAA5533687.1 NAD-dependent epimerase/dehydratase family protein [Taibaiella lutea]
MILVTGASGFLGLHLLQALAQQPLPVLALYNKHVPDVSFPNVSFRQCDLLDPFAVEDCMKGITHVYHCAAIVSFDPAFKKRMIEENVAATANVANAALEAGIEKLVHVSSVAALGRVLYNGEASINEETHWEESKTNSAYAESKYLSEMEVWRAMAEGLNAVIVNPSLILGEGDWERSSAKLIQIVAKEFPWYTLGVNGWVDAKDVAAAMVLLMDSDISDERFIISCGNFSYKDIFTKMAEALNTRAPYREASPLMTEIVWRAELFKSRLANKEATITKDSARAAQAKCFYSNEKFLTAFPDFQYRSMDVTIQRMAKAFMGK